MNEELTTSSYDTKVPMPHEGQDELSPSGKFLFSEKTIASLVELGSVLEKIHKRLISEGYTIKDGKIFKIEPITQNETN